MPIIGAPRQRGLLMGAALSKQKYLRILVGVDGGGEASQAAVDSRAAS